MQRCGRCEREIDGDARFCPVCGAPQTAGAREEFDRMVRERAGAIGSGTGADSPAGAVLQSADGDRLRSAGSYLLGYATVVLGVATLPGPEGVAFALAGVALLPPTRHLLGRPFGRPFKRAFMIGSYVVLTLVGASLAVL